MNFTFENRTAYFGVKIRENLPTVTFVPVQVHEFTLKRRKITLKTILKSQIP